MSAANELVTAGHLDQAAVIYGQLLDQGVEDASVYYNLGNVAMQQRQPPTALALYERAAELSPRDSDIRHNLALAREQQASSAGSSGRGRAGVDCPGEPVAVDGQRVSAMLATGSAWFLLGFLVLAYRHFQPGKRPAALRLAGMLATVLVVVSSLALVSRMQV